MKNIKESLFWNLKDLNCLFIIHDITNTYQKIALIIKFFKMNDTNIKSMLIKIEIKRE